MPHEKQHGYAIRTEWTGNLGEGTTSYRAYSRDHVISAAGKPELPGSSDPAFRGDAAQATALHEEAHRLCFIANSVNFRVAIEPTVIVAG